MKNNIIFEIYPCDSYDNEAFAPQFFDEEAKENVSAIQPKPTA
jgi:hypothetical protein